MHLFIIAVRMSNGLLSSHINLYCSARREMQSSKKTECERVDVKVMESMNGEKMKKKEMRTEGKKVYHHTEHWGPPGLCAKSTALHSADS